MTIWTDDQLLGLDPMSARADTFRFDLLDADGNLIGEVAPDSEQAITLSNDTGRTIMRTLSGMTLTPSESADVNVLTMRVRPSMILENGSEFPLGVFIFTDDPRRVRSFGTYIESASLSDQWLILDQQLPDGVSFAPNTNIGNALAQLLIGAGLTTYSIETTSQTLKDPMSYAAGQKRSEAVLATAAAAGWVVYFANDGTFTARTPPDLETAVPTFSYDAGGVIVDGSIALGNNLLSAPNFYKVISTNSADVPVVGTYTVPASAPHSYAQRGFYIPEVIQAQGITTAAEANTAARTAAASDSAGFEVADFATSIDPRHDTFDVVEFLTVNYREVSWTFALSSGAQMTHKLRRVYS